MRKPPKSCVGHQGYIKGGCGHWCMSGGLGEVSCILCMYECMQRLLSPFFTTQNSPPSSPL